MNPLSIHTTVKLNNRAEMPLFGLGTWQAKGAEAELAVIAALQAGCRLVDTAAIYGNEAQVGSAIRKSGIPRKQIFVTTKLWNDDHGNPEKALDASLQRLGMSYVDLYLIHWPVEGKRTHAWSVLERLYAEGKCRAIGVSNYTVRHLKEMLSDAAVTPAVNQVEFSPFLYQKELHEFCRGRNIQLEAYSPLARGEKLKDARLAAIAQKYKKTSAQIMIRWALQHGIVAIPKSVSRERILENADVFDFNIAEEDMKALDGLNEDFRLCWDPTKIL